MLAIAQSAVLVGISSLPVRIEVEATRGVPSFELVGLASTAVRESRVRVKSALAGVGVDISEYRVTVNMAPADVKKSGSSFDLAIALATMIALEVLPERCIDDVLILGELSLNGTLQSLRGVVAHLLGAKERGVERVIMSAANEHEASLVDGVEVELGRSLSAVVASLRGEEVLSRPRAKRRSIVRRPVEDLADVRGQPVARRALEVAAAGGHNMLLIGPPGAGKTMLARRLPGILPLLSREETLEVIAIHGVAGLINDANVIAERPFRAPHHTASDIALVGGGENARPGEVSLAHHGVLFLDELAELRRSALESLRQPLEDGIVTICRTRMSTVYPARPMLIAATNPCPCGNRGDLTDRCRCSAEDVRVYRRRLSGPLLDRLDVHVMLPPVSVLDLQSRAGGESSAVIRKRVERTRAVQRERWTRREVSAPTNAHLSQADVDRVCQVDDASREILAQAVTAHGLSARAYGKVLRVARTIADLEGSAALTFAHVSEALAGRSFDREKHPSKTTAPATNAA